MPAFNGWFGCVSAVACGEQRDLRPKRIDFGVERRHGQRIAESVDENVPFSSGGARREKAKE
jgi:hypothetical protein